MKIATLVSTVILIVVFSQLGVMIGYIGSKGTHLRISRNINQSVAGVRPFPRLPESSPFLPGALLGNITQVESTGHSSYNALWLTVNKRLYRGLQLNASYTWSKSIDYNSSSSGVFDRQPGQLMLERSLLPLRLH